MLKLYLRHSKLVTSSHIKIHYHFIFNHSLFTNLFVQAVKFVMWVKPQGTSSPESMNTYRKTLSLTSFNICKNHVSSIVNEVVRGNFKSFLQKYFIAIKRIRKIKRIKRVKSMKSTKSIKTLNK